MTLNDVQKAYLAMFAARAAGKGASLEQMKAICICVRNRVLGGWHDGNWITVLEHADEVAANIHPERVILDPNSRVLQRLIADIDDIYFSGRSQRPGATEAVSATGGELAETLEKCFFWFFVDQPPTPWFKQTILDRQDAHPMRAQMGLMMFFE